MTPAHRTMAVCLDADAVRRDDATLEAAVLEAAVAGAIEAEPERREDREISIDIDDATAVNFAAPGFPPPFARGSFCLSRAVGILARAREQSRQGGRDKGPVPPACIWT